MGLTSLINSDNFQSTWKIAIREKLADYGFTNEAIQRMGYDQAKTSLKERILDTG